MSVISYSENSERLLIPFDGDKALADFNQPFAQGLKWAYGLGKIGSEELVVLGLGGGFHIAALLDTHPGVKLTVIEFRSSLVNRFKHQFSEYLDRVEICELQTVEDLKGGLHFLKDPTSESLVLSFQECWGENYGQFLEVFSQLSGKTQDYLNYHIRELEVTVKARMVPVSQIGEKLAYESPLSNLYRKNSTVKVAG